MGATGTVGRQLIALLHDHPWFRVVEAGGSPGSAGKTLGGPHPDSQDLPDEIADLTLKSLDDNWTAPLILSAIPGSVAANVEGELARRGHLVVSNASAYRMDPQVPLLIPEVNSDHLALVEAQTERWPGVVVTNPNCSVVGLAMALAPIHRTFGLEQVIVTTFQAISGAGRPGPAAGDLLDNVIPHIAGEEEKIASEPLKILGTLEKGSIRPASFRISAQAHRVPVTHGHFMAVSVKTGRTADLEELRLALDTFESGAEARLPSAPARPLEVLADVDRPQPRLDRDRGAGMTVSVGRLRRCEVLDFKFSALVHNLVRGAAGAALLNAELCRDFGLVARAPTE